jgi:hypothetical protein
MSARKECRNTRAHGVTHDIGARETDMIEQRSDIAGHAGAVIGGRIVELARGAMSAIVERDDAPSSLDESCDPAGIDPIHVRGGSKTVHEDDRLAFSFVQKSDFDRVVLKTLHLCNLQGKLRTAIAPMGAAPF